MNKLITLFLVAPVFLFAQKTDENYSSVEYRNTTCHSSFTKVRLEGANNSETVAAYLKRTVLNLKDYRAGLKLNYIKESPGGFHYSFTQTFNGIEIYQTEIKVNVDHQQVIHSIFDNSENTSGWNLNITGIGNNTVIAHRSGNESPVLCQKRIENNAETLEANGELLFKRDINSYVNHDSLAYGKAFFPDPLTSS
jgi:Zn-dependent metalloprotease